MEGQRPKRVGYWKASYTKVPYNPEFVNRNFWRNGTTFVESEREVPAAEKWRLLRFAGRASGGQGEGDWKIFVNLSKIAEITLSISIQI